MKTVQVLLAAATVCLLTKSPAPARLWTSVSGATLEAELVEQRIDDVVLSKPDGNQVAIKKAKLSPADNSYLQQVALGRVDPSNEATGPVPEKLGKLFGDELVNAEDDEVSTAALDGKVIGVYFSAHWCPPCRQFTPKLVKAYNDLKKDDSNFEIVFVSSDRSEDAMFEYMEHEDMPWLAVPYQSERKSKLKQLYGVSGIPMLVLIDGTGKVLTKSARGEVSSRGAKALKEYL